MIDEYNVVLLCYCSPNIPFKIARESFIADTIAAKRFCPSCPINRDCFYYILAYINSIGSKDNSLSLLRCQI